MTVPASARAIDLIATIVSAAVAHLLYVKIQSRRRTRRDGRWQPTDELPCSSCSWRPDRDDAP